MLFPRLQHLKMGWVVACPSYKSWQIKSYALCMVSAGAILDGRKGSLFSEFLKDLGMKSVCQHWLTQKLSVWHGILCFIPRFLFEICQQVLALLDMDQAEKSCISCVFVAQSERRFPVQMAKDDNSTALVSEKNSFNFRKAWKMHWVAHPFGWN